LDALAVHPAFDRSVDVDSLCALVRYSCVPAPRSIYRDAHKVPAGSTVTVDADGVVGPPVPYWSFAEVAVDGASNPFTGSVADAAVEFESLLRASVTDRMVSDRPVGAFLSGGLDSSTIVAFMAEASSAPVDTFTIGSTDADFDESDGAEAVARHLGANHHALVVTAADALAVVEQIPRIYDEPFSDSSQIPTFLVAQLAAASVTVAMSGDGGDELFGGYNRYRWLPLIERGLRSVPSPARRGVARAIHRAGPRRIERLATLIPPSRRPRQLALKAAKVGHLLATDDPSAMYLRVVSHVADPGSVVLGGRDGGHLLAASPADWPPLSDPIEQMMAVDFLTYLPDDILTKVDRATMAVGLEGRIPLLDRRIVEFAARLPRSLRGGNGVSKPVIREALYRRVPKHIVDRPKSGFGIPLDAWLRSPLRSWGEELLSDPDAGRHLRVAPIRRVWDEHQSGCHDHGYQLWDVLTFLAWADHRRVA
jgi:asparagine synthase (glutamine-hydrolysing)